MVNSLMIDFDVDIYITGSNAKLLSGELATYLGGRYVEIKIYPFSFAEILDIMRETQEEVNEAEAFLHYLSYGGMPFIYQNKMEEQAALMYLEDLFDSIILKDVAQRNKIRDIGAFKNLLLYFLAEIGNTYSAASIKKYLKNENRSVSTETLYNYIRVLQRCMYSANGIQGGISLAKNLAVSGENLPDRSRIAPGRLRP